MENEIKAILELLKQYAELSVSNSLEIVGYSKDKFIQHKAYEVKRMNEDSLRLLPALEQLINSEFWNNKQI